MEMKNTPSKVGMSGKRVNKKTGGGSQGTLNRKWEQEYRDEAHAELNGGWMSRNEGTVGEGKAGRHDR